jgi:hypothetical protein
VVNTDVVLLRCCRRPSARERRNPVARTYNPLPVAFLHWVLRGWAVAAGSTRRRLFRETGQSCTPFNLYCSNRMSTTSFVVRCAIAVAALTSIRYTTDFEHVDVSVPSECLAGIAAKMSPTDASTCIYHDVRLRGQLQDRDFKVIGREGASLDTDTALIVSQSDDSGFTWRSLALLLVAVAVWVPSLLSLLLGQRSEAA